MTQEQTLERWAALRGGFRRVGTIAKASQDRVAAHYNRPQGSETIRACFLCDLRLEYPDSVSIAYLPDDWSLARVERSLVWNGDLVKVEDDQPICPACSDEVEQQTRRTA